jgi:hypothetical protein
LARCFASFFVVVLGVVTEDFALCGGPGFVAQGLAFFAVHLLFFSAVVGFVT